MDYFIADLHLGHKNVLSFDNRPFTDIESHDHCIIDNWNNEVEMEDNVYILGDISWHNATKTVEIFKRLNGNKHLIRGNHDNKLLKSRELQLLFVEICDYKELTLSDGEGIVLCHYPIPCFKNHYYGWHHLYGHVHTSFEDAMMKHVKLEMEELYSIPCNMFNVGCMHEFMDYTPRTLDYIVKNGGK